MTQFALDPRTFPSDGKVLVVDMDAPISLRSKYGNRAYFWHESQLVRLQDFPPRVEAIAVSKDLVPGDERRIFGFADQLKIRRRARISGLSRLEEWLGQQLNGVDLSLDPAPLPTSEPTPAPKAPLPFLLGKSVPVDTKLAELKARALKLIDVQAVDSIPLYVDPEMPVLGAGEVRSEDGFFWVPIDQIEPMPRQPRETFTREDMLTLASAIKKRGQEEPIWVRRITNTPGRNYELIEGERRLLVGHALNLNYLKATLRKPKTRIEQYRQSVGANFGKLELTRMETARAIERLRNEDPALEGLSLTDQYRLLAPDFRKSVAWVEYHHKFLRLHPDLQARLEPPTPSSERLSLAFAMYLSTVPDHAVQLEIDRVARANNMTVDQARNYARIRAEESGTSIGGRKRLPSDDFRGFNRFVRKLAQDVGIYLDMPKVSFEAMLQRRKPAELAAIQAVLEDQILQLQRLKKAFSENG